MGRTIFNLAVTILIVSLASSAMTQGVSLLTRGVMIVEIGDSSSLSGLKIQKDGKILVSGSSFVDNQALSILIRRNGNGSSDRNFGKSGMVTTGLPEFYVQSDSLSLQEDGKAVIAGTAKSIKSNKWTGASNEDVLVMRYSSDGLLDKGFDGSGWVKTDIDGDKDHCYGLALQKDRKIVVIGNTSRMSGYHFMVIRYNEYGKLDRSFGKRGKVITRVGSVSEDSARAVVIQPDKKIIVAGLAHRRRASDMAVIRYSPEGVLDNTFGIGGKVMKQFGGDEERISSVANAIALQPDGKIVVAVNLYRKGSEWNEGRLVRLNNDGSLDHTFGNHGSVTVNMCGYYFLEAVSSVILQPNGKILFTGASYDKEKSCFTIISGRYSSDGRLDTSFGQNGFIQILTGRSYAEGKRIAIQSDGKIIVAGNVGKVNSNTRKPPSSRYPSDLVLFRLNANGQIDGSFGSVNETTRSSGIE